MRRPHSITAVLLMLAFSAACKPHSAATPITVRVVRDPVFAADLTRFETQFTLTSPATPSGRPVRLEVKDDVSYVDLMKRLNALEADVLILNSAANVPNDTAIGAQLGSQTLVCGVHPAFVPTNVAGEQRQAAEMYVQFLASHCTQSLAQTPVSALTQQSQPPDQPEQPDPHRLPCTTARCAKIKQFLKDHYCGASPFGNGPDDGCDMREIQNSKLVATVTVDFNCTWDEKSSKSICTQTGQPSPEFRNLLLEKLRHLGLPAHADKEVHFRVVEASEFSLAAADYSHLEGSNVSNCSVLVAISADGRASVIREQRIHKIDADVPDDTSYWPLDIADADGDGHLEIILRADAYEDHWFEVVELRGDSIKTIYSGMGYYL